MSTGQKGLSLSVPLLQIIYSNKQKSDEKQNDTPPHQMTE